MRSLRLSSQGFARGLATGALALAACMPGAALAAGDEVVAASSGGDGRFGDELVAVDILADELDAAESENLLASVETAAARYRTATLKARLPEQVERGNEAARRLYKMQRSRYDVVEMLLESQTLEDFIRQIDYLYDVTRADVREITAASSLKAEAKEARAAYAEKRKSARARVAELRSGLEEAQGERIAKAEQGVAEAQRQVGAIGRKREAGQEAANTDAAVLDSGADWSMSKEEFVNEWAPRLDAYLAGSPLAGQGANFAKSAWKWCIDPRWSAAISNTESSKGAACIRPHNAWGWGAADSDPYNLAAEWGSWEEAIDAHARGLAGNYGYTITLSGAKTYCPNTWVGWYNRTLKQMSMI